MSTATPTNDERRAAVCRAVAASPRLVRYAARITRNLDDAEDAYQRAMEIALRSAPVVENERFMAWLRTVLRNEALSIAERRQRECPGAGEDAADTADRLGSGNEGIDDWRHRYLIVVEAFGRLTDAQRVCLILQARGASYVDITEATGFSRRKVERAILEGREALRSWEHQVDTGEACVRVRASLDDLIAGDCDRRERMRVERHVRHCGHCRTLLRQRRRRVGAMGALAPTCLVPNLVDLTPPDPGPFLNWFERASTSGTVRAGNTVQMLIEMPGSVMTKAAASVVAAAAVVGVGGPLLTAGAGDEGLHTAARPTAAARVAASAPAAPAPRRPVQPAAVAPAKAAPEPTRAAPVRAVVRPAAPVAVAKRTVTAAGFTRVASLARPAAPPASRPSAGYRPAAPVVAHPAPAAPAAPPPPSAPPANADAAGAASISIGPSGP